MIDLTMLTFANWLLIGGIVLVTIGVLLPEKVKLTT